MILFCIPLNINAVNITYTLNIKNYSNNFITNANVDLYTSSGSHTHPVVSNGVCIMTLTQGVTYYLNVYASGYERVQRTFVAAASVASIFLRETAYYPTFNNDPLGNYSPPNHEWNQHFGWRLNSLLDYHTGVDYSRKADGTRYGDMSPKPDVYNCHYGRVNKAGSLQGVGFLIQVYHLSYYASYLHLQSANKVINSYIPSLEVLSQVGTIPGVDAYHLHFSVSSESTLDKDNRSFKDPLVFID